ncbi:MAG: hypothetical protein AAF761_05125 [Pseudomonadota bacterium]
MIGPDHVLTLAAALFALGAFGLFRGTGALMPAVISIHVMALAAALGAFAIGGLFPGAAILASSLGLAGLALAVEVCFVRGRTVDTAPGDTKAKG